MTSGVLYKPILLQTACFNPVLQDMTNQFNPTVTIIQQFSSDGVELNTAGEPKYVALEPSLQTLALCLSPIQTRCPVTKEATTNMFSSSLLIETKSLLIFRHVSLASLQFVLAVKLIVLQQYLLNRDHPAGHVSVKIQENEKYSVDLIGLEGRWFHHGQCARLRIKRSGFESWPGTFCCVLGQDTLLSQCHSPQNMLGFHVDVIIFQN